MKVIFSCNDSSLVYVSIVIETKCCMYSISFTKEDTKAAFQVTIILGFVYIRQILLYVQRRIRVDVAHVFGVKTNPYLKIKYTFEIFHQPAVKL